MKKKNNKIKFLILLIIICIIIYIVNDIYKENKIKFKNENNNYESFNTTLISKKSQILQEKIITMYQNYEVIAKLEIPKISLETYVLKEFSVDTMNISVTKFWGVEPNEFGNFSIVGHNYKKENMFSNLDELQINDTIFLTDNKNGKFEYVIYDIYKVKPDDISPIENVYFRREITLITCVNYTNNRLIVKAKEIV